ncbi:hypothetical protein ACFWBZ_36245 [Streptomyces griseus]|uniref:hypothetical protein n=1 Tax=Streptomyces griseus TaxID=1911 RepID=UPI003678F2F3
MPHHSYPDSQRAGRQVDRHRRPPVTPASIPQPATVQPTMDRRSWYMPKRAADDLARAVAELHYDTRQPKHAVLAELVAAALLHLPEVSANLRSL